ncbi:hypothetical protein N7448_005079 [Penicillium atrosanguineum]|uniref:Uncharacterized protein n=1 Tax=Penicillium atrosanguineum TaxID=1132637 RepID=A0A9W9U0C1_9EURO|nr:uncharacterized protein N7443_008809 [Penicillium atrosanguineum]KAJ5125765.1 hypothetical protein N7526_007942 [Penicillium atrosanguineum]KAJ5136525.1 hypothetical protein N7448_005079 [Penicillium atrosanguineum]KAJ5292856.1 hypothetical protein N7443_008809 [Penicillium atrosanguineum]KAJ5303106.1 hypothetical protein N7476_009905 [Penicillium atrosanguineum]
MEVSEDTVQRIQEFVQNRQAAEKESAREPLRATNLQAYAHRLDETLRELQEQVQRQEDELNKLREIGSHGLLDISNDPWVRVAQARRAKKAYDSLLQSEDELPPTGSILPSLLAVADTSQLIKESKVSVTVTAEKLSTDRERLRVEEANLRDSRAIASGLRERIQQIRSTNARKQKQTPSQVAQDVAKEQKKKNKELDRASAALKVSLDSFIDETLAPMLAAEDLGGPTVGDALEVSDATLKAGYTAHGNPKKPKQPAEPENGAQQRIDQFLQRNNDSLNLTNKREAAATEVHELLDALLEAGNSYVDLKRDSAASRFLVRSKVAQFHPRDARRLRLIDFGRSLGN